MRPPGGAARTCCSCAHSPARFGLPFGSRWNVRFVRLADVASLSDDGRLRFETGGEHFELIVG